MTSTTDAIDPCLATSSFFACLQIATNPLQTLFDILRLSFAGEYSAAQGVFISRDFSRSDH